MGQAHFPPSTLSTPHFCPQLARRTCRTTTHPLQPSRTPSHPILEARATVARVADFSHHFPRSSSRPFFPHRARTRSSPSPSPSRAEMGVPAYFRWIREKYPKCIVNVLEDAPMIVDGVKVPVNPSAPSPNGIEFDNLYLDMNGCVGAQFTMPPPRPRGGGRVRASYTLRRTDFLTFHFLSPSPSPSPPPPLPPRLPLAASSTRACTPRTPRLPRRRRTCSAPSSCTSTA
jgi:hypothetical protein